MHKVYNHQSKELLVVPSPDAVVKPEAMVIEPSHALVTLTAVLGGWVDPLGADLAGENFLALNRLLVSLLLRRVGILVLCLLVQHLGFLRGHVAGVTASHVVSELDHREG